MKTLWCWRCRMEMPMLNEEEYAIARRLYTEGFRNYKHGKTRQEQFKSMLDYYKELTGFEETEPNAILHHQIEQYGPPCTNCGKPYRTTIASFCAACGNIRVTEPEKSAYKNAKSWWQQLFTRK